MSSILNLCSSILAPLQYRVQVFLVNPTAAVLEQVQHILLLCRLVRLRRQLFAHGMPHVDKESFKELKEMSQFVATVAAGASAGITGGALTAIGAYGAATTFASASTGTAIATLGGAAASNATLAFFGGGSIAAGGLGMAPLIAKDVATSLAEIRETSPTSLDGGHLTVQAGKDNPPLAVEGDVTQADVER